MEAATTERRAKTCVVAYAKNAEAKRRGLDGDSSVRIQKAKFSESLTLFSMMWPSTSEESVFENV